MRSRALEDHLDSPVRSLVSMIQKRITRQTSYFGISTQKMPTDFWVYQEIIYEKKPDVIIEVGNYHGGSTLALAHFCDAMGHGRIIGVDINHDVVDPRVKQHPRIRLITGDACAVIPKVAALAGDGSAMVIEDSLHTYENTLNVLRGYHPFVTKGQYLIVEDSICHHGLDKGPNPGPFEAIEKFLTETSGFEVDRSKESFVVTWNPKGYLLKQ